MLITVTVEIITRLLSINLIKRKIMNKLKMLVLVATIAFSSILTASTNPTEKSEPTSITKTVGELLKNPELQLNKEVNALVSFLINEKDEIVVLSVETDNKAVEDYIKNRLNYKKISKETISPFKALKIPVKITKSS